VTFVTGGKFPSVLTRLDIEIIIEDMEFQNQPPPVQATASNGTPVL